MKFTVVMPSYLGNYKGAATNREEKILRAVQSVIDQTYSDWELIIIADGCDKTVDIARKHIKDKRVKGFLIEKQSLWSGTVRNTAIERATGDWVIYLDIDDCYEPDYLWQLSEAIEDNPGAWYYVDDLIYNKEWIKRRCEIGTLGKCGTSNIIHPKGHYWNKVDNYAHDHRFIKMLKSQLHSPVYLSDICGYKVCHIPGSYDV